jgi:RNA polymerase sigma factor for flagellar operon FliA
VRLGDCLRNDVLLPYAARTVKLRQPRTNDVETQQLWSAFRTFRRRKDRDRLIDQYLPLADFVAGQVAKGLTKQVDIGDIRSYAALGLIDAIERFDPSMGYKFETYAVIRIRGMIIDELRAYDWVPRSVRDKSKAIDRARVDLTEQLNRFPLDRETAAQAGLTQSEFGAAMVQKAAANVESIEGLSEPDRFRSVEMDAKRQASQGHVGKRIEDASATADIVEMRDALVAAISMCPEREKIVLTLYYYEGLTLEEIGQWMGVTESRVCQIHTRAMEQIRVSLRVA